MAVRPDGPGGRTVTHALRAARVTRAEPALSQAAGEPGAQILGARQGVQPVGEGRRHALPARHHDVPADGALPAGAMSRWLPWLAELQPELFIELGRALAEEK